MLLNTFSIYFLRKDQCRAAKTFYFTAKYYLYVVTFMSCVDPFQSDICNATITSIPAMLKKVFICRNHFEEVECVYRKEKLRSKPTGHVQL